MRRLPGGADVRVVTAPFFLATKLEEFAGRGRGDFTASHDIEDLVALVDGRAELAEEVRAAPGDLREYLSARISRLLGTDAFLEAIPGHLPPDDASQQRAPLVLERLRALAAADAR